MAISKFDLGRQAQGRPSQGVASQATHVEQSRAIAQVQGALVVAQERPRNVMAAIARMREACENPFLADRAFFSFKRGGEQITGPSIHLATELARCWGNIDYGIAELSRSETESEMLSYAWDQETNARNTNSFIAPHIRDTRQGAKALTETRDIYENNANLGARRLRECIFRVLPVSFRQEAEDICAATLQNGGGEPIEKRREKLIEAFAGLGISRRRVELRVGRSADQFTALDIGTLRVVFGSLKRGETTAAEEFPDDTAERATAELKAQGPALAPAQPAAEQKAGPEPAGGPPDEPGLPLDKPAAGSGYQFAYADGTLSRNFPTPDETMKALIEHAGDKQLAEVDDLSRLNEGLFKLASNDAAQSFVKMRMGKAPMTQAAKNLRAG